MVLIVVISQLEMDIWTFWTLNIFIDFNGASDLLIHLTSSSARSAFPPDSIPSGNDILQDVMENRKLWIVRKQEKKKDILESDLIRQREPDELEPYVLLIRDAKAQAPSVYAAAESSGLTMSAVNLKSPGCKEFTQGDFQKLIKNKIKLWIEEKIRFEVQVSNSDSVTLEFFPEQDFLSIKWILASQIKRDVHSFNLVAIRSDSTETIIHSKNKLGEFRDHTFAIRLCEEKISTKVLWKCAHDEERFDLFFSHRKWADKDVVEVFHSQLNGIEHPKDPNRKIHPFWDEKCLRTTGDWEEGFISALRQSKVAVLFISNDCLKNMKQADVKEDNVLLEWEETLQRYPSQNIIIFPILVGRKKAFDNFNHLDFPDEKHSHPRSPRVLTIRKVVKEIFRIQGESIVELSGINLEEAKTKLLNTLSKIREHETGKSTSPLVNVLLTSTQDQRLREILRPLDKEMKAERTRLLNAHVADTRLWLLKNLMEFLNPSESETRTERVLWLQGNAGVGKSVISAFAANELERRNLLAGMFYAKHDDSGRNSARNLIRTLCYQLCEWNADFARLILDKLKDEEVVKESLRDESNIEKMFTILILTPLQEIAKTNPRAIVLVVDALDETGLMGFRSEILQVFSIHCRKLPSFVKLLVTSRPEGDIVKTFEKLETKKLEATSGENRADALIYAKHFLRKHGSIEDLDELACLLTEKSGGLFIWLAMACRILEAVAAVGQRITAAAIEKLGDGGSDGAMDAIYFSTFDRIFGKTPPNPSKDVLSFITLAFEPLRVGDISEILKIPIENVSEMIGKLQPILYLNDEGCVRFFHKSVADYLTDPKRFSDPRFAVQTEEFHSKLTGKCLQLLQESLKYNIANLPEDTLHKDVPDFAQLVSTHVSPHLEYVALYFWRHHSESKDKRANFDLIKEFTETKLLNWIELLSLIKSTNQIPPATRALTSNYISPTTSTLSNSNDFTVELLTDAARLYQKFNTAISASALQTYVTAIPFSPKKTRTYQHFINILPTQRVPHVATGTGNFWPACITTIEGNLNSLMSVAISLDGKWIVAGSLIGIVRIWSMESGEEIRTLQAHDYSVESVVISTDGTLVVSGSVDKTIRIWSVENAEKIKTFTGHLQSVNSVAISQDGNWIVSGSSDKTVKLWSMEINGGEIRNFVGHLHSVRSVSISPNGKWIVSGSFDKTIKIWSLESGDLMNSLNHTGLVRSITISADGTWIVSGSSDKNIKIWSMATGELIKTLTGHTDSVNSVAISVNGKWIVSGSENGVIYIWDTESSELAKTLKGHSRSVCSIAISLDGRQIVSGSEDKRMRIWSMVGGEETSMLTGHSEKVVSIVVVSDRKWIVSWGLETTIFRWSMESGELIQTFRGHVDNVNCVAISLDRKWIVSGSYDTTIKIWSMESGEIIKTLRGHSGAVSCIAISMDRKWIVSGSHDATVRIWSVQSAEMSRVLYKHTMWGAYEHTRWVQSVEFSGDEKQIVSRSFFRTITHDFETGQVIDNQYRPEWERRDDVEHEKNQISLILKENISVNQWDGWIRNGKKFYCWIPPEFRKVEPILYQWKYYPGGVDLSTFSNKLV
ncbi:hypothetical protein HK098_000595 [Nowakowskiella sp. JEL0407]|nr:hypothetical protein HK098_000595 [Nowakowskiella sp. JEL0407]